jgi:hypothetical protein
MFVGKMGALRCNHTNSVTDSMPVHERTRNVVLTAGAIPEEFAS